MDYEVNQDTLAIIPAGQSKCKILEKRKSYNLNKNTFKVIEHSCEYFGASYKSRLEGSHRYINTRYKTPIVIEESDRVIFFPISSVTRKNTMWISYNNILEYYPNQVKKGITNIKFKNGLKMELPVSYYSFNNQYLKASRLSAIVADRIIKK